MGQEKLGSFDDVREEDFQKQSHSWGVSQFVNLTTVVAFLKAVPLLSI